MYQKLSVIGIIITFLLYCEDLTKIYNQSSMNKNNMYTYISTSELIQAKSLSQPLSCQKAIYIDSYASSASNSR